jgi:hypothetical protein
MVSIVGARCFAPDIGHAQRAPTMQGAHNLRSRGGSRTALTGTPQRFTPLDDFQEDFPLRILGALSLDPRSGIVI